MRKLSYIIWSAVVRWLYVIWNNLMEKSGQFGESDRLSVLRRKCVWPGKINNYSFWVRCVCRGSGEGKAGDGREVFVLYSNELPDATTDIPPRPWLDIRKISTGWVTTNEKVKVNRICLNKECIDRLRTIGNYILQ